MKRRLIRMILVPALLVLVSIINSQLSTALAQGTVFTYQGQLGSGGAPANGNFDLTFSLFNVSSGGSPVAGTLTNSGIVVSNGIFAVTLDFGPGVFTGGNLWLEMAVETNGAGSFTTLSPRQQLLPTPYAIFANSSSNLSGTLSAGQLSGTVNNSQLANSSLTVTAGTGLSGGGAVALGGATTLNNAGVTSLTGNADVTASPSTGAVTLNDTATNSNIANRIVKRDGSGNFSAGSVTLSGNLTLPATTASTGIIFSGAQHTFTHVRLSQLLRRRNGGQPHHERARQHRDGF
ncbi:MAG TPA: hypothetical protein VKV04_08585 [Verrucomicrobiae bacterium]|nr:hypothetical protein [Verrucomicrobiae bacterium]